MDRQLRIEFEGVFYHVTSRGNMRETIFFEDRDRESFLDQDFGIKSLFARAVT
jgi:hypothetical protein